MRRSTEPVVVSGPLEYGEPLAGRVELGVQGGTSRRGLLDPRKQIADCVG